MRTRLHLSGRGDTSWCVLPHPIVHVELVLISGFPLIAAVLAP